MYTKYHKTPNGNGETKRIILTICEKCGQAPAPLAAQGRLYLWPPVTHTAGKIISRLKRENANFDHNDRLTTIYVDFIDNGMPDLVSAIAADLLPEEREGTKALLMADDTPPAMDDIGEVMTFAALEARVRAEWLVGVLREERLHSVFQPIFATHALEKPFAHECLIRASDEQGNTITPDRLFGAAQSADLIFQLDRAARAANVRNAHNAGLGSNLFINFTPSSIYDPASCLRSTIEVVNDCGLNRNDIVFEVIETEKVASVDHLGAILKSYRDSGFRVALDDVGSGYSTLNMLPQLRPDIIKIDRELIDHVDQDRYKQAIVGNLTALARDLDIEVVAEGVERREELDFLTNLKVDYIQGFYLGKPSRTGHIA